MRKINEEGKSTLKRFEAFIPFAYDDADGPKNRRRIKPGDTVRGTLTIGYGHTGRDVTPGLTIDEARADQLLSLDLASAESAVFRLVHVPLTDNQFAALVSFAFNAGNGALEGSTLLKKLNAGNYEAVPGELMKWTKTTIAGKKVQSNGLVNRRAAEAGLWAKGAFIQSSGTPALMEKPPLISGNAVALGTAALSGGALQYVPTTGPVAYALAALMVGAGCFLLYRYVFKRVGN